MVTHLFDLNVGLLPDLPGDGSLQALPRLDETGDDGVEVLWPRRLSPQQATFSGADQHDDGGIRPRKIVLTTLIIGAQPQVTSISADCGSSAGPAELVLVVVVDHGLRIRQQCRRLAVEKRSHGTQTAEGPSFRQAGW